MPRSEKAEITALCMIYDGDALLLQDRVPKGPADTWSGYTFPGGHIEPGESFIKGIQREILEETGLKISAPRLCGIKQFQTEDDARYMVALFKTDRFEGALTSSEEGQMRWIQRGELKNYRLVDDFWEHLRFFDDDSQTEMFYERIETASGFQWRLKVY